MVELARLKALRACARRKNAKKDAPPWIHRMKGRRRERRRGGEEGEGVCEKSHGKLSRGVTYNLGFSLK